MKFSQIGRMLVVAGAIFGTVVIVISQPGGARGQQSMALPIHSIIPKSVDISQVQEFKDAGTIHLNEMQKLQMSTAGKAYPTKTIIITRIDFVRIWNDRFYVLGATDRTVGGGSPKATTAAEMAVLSYIFDQGIDRIAKGSSAKGNATPTGITASISSNDLGMTPSQLKQAVIQYVDSHHMQFWNRARVELASNR